MTGADVPYRLRPHKGVDRRLFVELLSRWERWQSLRLHAYVSMAGYTMEDQKLIHRAIGIERLLAFDQDEDVVRRQRFNRPTDATQCVAATADEITADIDGALREAGIEDAAGYVVWLDYTTPRQIGQQLREFRALVAQLRPGDLVRITVNAAPGGWGKDAKATDAEGRPLSADAQRELIFAKLTQRLGEAVPPDVTPASLDAEGLARAISRAIGFEANRAVSERGWRLEPLSAIRYADGQQMLAVGAGMVEADHVPEMRQRLDLDHWPYAAADWSDVKLIAVPDLTVRERLFLERKAHLPRATLQDLAGFDFDDATKVEGFVENYRSYYRHYPALSPVEL